MPAPVPILAADIGGLIAIAFMVISFISWLSNIISGQSRPGQRPQQPQRPARPPQNKRLRDEIEAFMRESQGQPRPQPGARPLEAPPAGSTRPAPSPARPAPAGQGQKKNKLNRPAKPAAESSTSRRPPGEDVSQRRVSTSPLGTDVQRHVNQHMAERVGAIASRDVEPTVDDSVAAHFAPFSAETVSSADPAARAGAAPVAATLLQMLRSPQGVRQALVLGEILKPPVAMRGSRSSKP